MLKKTIITIDGVEIPLLCTMGAWSEMERSGQDLDPVRLRSTLVESATPVTNTLSMIEILGNTGRRILEGAEPLSWEWIADHSRPGQLADFDAAIQEAVNEGFRMESTDPDAARDVVLEEIEKKEERDA